MWISMPELSGLLGSDTAMAIAKSLGGVEVYIPTRSDAEHKLARIAGTGGMKALCEAYGGIAVIMPNVKHSSRKERILSLLGKGKTRREIAEICGVTERYVYYLAALNRETPTGSNQRGKPHRAGQNNSSTSP